MFARLSIRTKITAVVALLVTALAGMGLLSVFKMRGLNENTMQIATNWLPSIKALGELHAGVISYRATVRSHLLAETIEEKQAIEKSLQKIVESNNNIRKSYERMITSPEERALYDDWSKHWQEYKDLVLTVMELSRKETGQHPREAIELNRQAGKLGNDSDAILVRDIELNNAGAEKETKAAEASYSSAFYIVVAIVGIATLLGAVAGFFVVRDVTRGIASILKPMQSLGEGDLQAEVPHRGEKTEIGQMADGLQIFKETLIAKRATDVAAARDAEAKIERGRRVDAVTREFEQMIGEIVSTVSSASTQLEASAGTLSTTATRSQALSTSVAAASEEATTNVQSVASATEELSSSVNEISRQVQESARMATEAVGQARGTTDRVGELAKAATRIGDVVELISTIAGQTNLLALNATIEAARAGDAGRGFAVVASEVKALAEQTAKATGEIGQQINSIQAATLESVDAIREISGTIERLSEISSTIAAAVEEQGAATQEISRNVQQAAQGTRQVSSNIADVQRGATDTGSASSQVLAAAQTLSADSGRLKAEVSKFLDSVRAA
ncbi:MULTISPECIES: methyl-accepting chemotaxis protein [unclassified Bradyrhizobium]|uniref:methyl-accepting chemotaxis protein n=1 Tax=unclassified Bradyrhizobium TaxID=2631580 RepID=UPI0023060A8C|nr:MULTISPECIES: methyl-accepting chemotaxis protein [unclassified Bradyrhizobium]MDA9445635.1 chemotaxis protein [Bradyrhizobium sp. CCBAU 21360]MDA9457684.1 chemotaxis protein [Bradyrhizobium sp. CCBAU 21359]